MATAVRQHTTTVEIVSAAAAGSFTARGDLVVEMPFHRFLEARVVDGLESVAAVVVPEARRVEVVLDEFTDPSLLVSAVHSLTDTGWDVCVLAPGLLLGEAHSALRRVPCSLQQWWLEGDGVCFGRLEIP